MSSGRLGQEEEARVPSREEDTVWQKLYITNRRTVSCVNRRRPGRVRGEERGGHCLAVPPIPPLPLPPDRKGQASKPPPESPLPAPPLHRYSSLALICCSFSLSMRKDGRMTGSRVQHCFIRSYTTGGQPSGASILYPFSTRGTTSFSGILG